MIKFNYLPKFSVVIFFTFILFTIIGTQLHELGHISVAKYLGYEIALDYGSMNYFPKGYLQDDNLKEINHLVEEYGYNNYNNWSEALKLKVEKLSDSLLEKYPKMDDNHILAIIVGGPMQTLLTSFTGLLILFFRRNKWRNRFKFLDWLAVFMSLFALREVFNFVQASYSTLFYSESNFLADEFKISRYLGLNEWMIPIIALIIGLFISCYIIFKIIPIKYRFTFILSGLIGGISGFVIWYGFLGRILFNSTICF